MLNKLCLVLVLELVVCGGTILAQSTSTDTKTEPKKVETDINVDATFKRLSRGKEYIEINKVEPFLSWQMKEFARYWKITNGKLSQTQFRVFVNKIRLLWETRNTGKPLTAIEFEKMVMKSADGYFFGRDQNKDGFLVEKEMSTRLRARYKTWDKDSDGKINISECQAYIRSFLIARHRPTFQQQNPSSDSKQKKKK